MTKFKIGDLVKCVDNYQTYGVVVGTVYKVTGYSYPNNLLLDDLYGRTVSSGGFYPRRFVLAVEHMFCELLDQYYGESV